MHDRGEAWKHIEIIQIDLSIIEDKDWMRNKVLEVLASLIVMGKLIWFDLTDSELLARNLVDKKQDIV